jgi:dTDP-4-dehydrorhamnose 3,5-epimerase
MSTPPHIEKLSVPGVCVLTPHIFEDERGCLFETFNINTFQQVMKQPISFMQDNHSISKLGALRGLHYQRPPHTQGKLVRATRGSIFDVAVDLRINAPTFGRWVGVELSAQNKKQLWIPEGFAHGFLALTEGAECTYKSTRVYAPGYEICIRWDDPAIGITWPLSHMTPIISDKDRNARTLQDILGELSQ